MLDKAIWCPFLFGLSIDVAGESKERIFCSTLLSIPTPSSSMIQSKSWSHCSTEIDTTPGVGFGANPWLIEFSKKGWMISFGIIQSRRCSGIEVCMAILYYTCNE